MAEEKKSDVSTKRRATVGDKARSVLEGFRIVNAKNDMTDFELVMSFEGDSVLVKIEAFSDRINDRHTLAAYSAPTFEECLSLLAGELGGLIDAAVEAETKQLKAAEASLRAFKKIKTVKKETK